MNRTQELTIIRNQLGDVAEDDLKELSVSLNEKNQVVGIIHSNGKTLPFNESLLRRRATDEQWEDARRVIGVKKGSTIIRSVAVGGGE